MKSLIILALMYFPIAIQAAVSNSPEQVVPQQERQVLVYDASTGNPICQVQLQRSTPVSGVPVCNQNQSLEALKVANRPTPKTAGLPLIYYSTCLALNAVEVATVGTDGNIIFSPKEELSGRFAAINNYLRESGSSTPASLNLVKSLQEYSLKSVVALNYTVCYPATSANKIVVSIIATGFIMSIFGNMIR